MVFFAFPDNVRWNAEQEAVEFGVEVGEYRGVVRISRRALQRLLRIGQPPSGASRPIICNERASRLSPSARSVSAN